MDVEFGNPLRFPPHEYRGIVLLRLPARVTSELILDTIRTLRDALLARDRPPSGSIPLPGPDRRLWVVQPGRVRPYQGSVGRRISVGCLSIPSMFRPLPELRCDLDQFIAEIAPAFR